MGHPEPSLSQPTKELRTTEDHDSCRDEQRFETIGTGWDGVDVELSVTKVGGSDVRIWSQPGHYIKTHLQHLSTSLSDPEGLARGSAASGPPINL